MKKDENKVVNVSLTIKEAKIIRHALMTMQLDYQEILEAPETTERLLKACSRDIRTIKALRAMLYEVINF